MTMGRGQGSAHAAPAFWSGALVVLGGVGVVVALSARRLGDFDLPWHLANGRIIARDGAIPRVDDLAYTARPIEYTEVAGDLLLYASMRLGGPLALQVLTAVVAVGVGVALWARARRAGPVAWLSAAVALAAMNAWLLARPATLGFALLALQLFLLDEHRRAPSSGRRALFAVVPLMFLWANTHPSVVLGVIVLGAYVATRWTSRLWATRFASAFPPHDGQDALRATMVGAAGVLASTLNPMGAALLAGPVRAQRDFGMVTEWVSPSLAFLFVVQPAVGGLLVLLLIALLAGREHGHRTPPVFDLGLVVLAVGLASTAVRLIPFSAVLVAPLVARRLAWVVPPTRAMAISAGSAVVLLGPLFWLTTSVSTGVGFEPTHFPERAVVWITKHEPRGRLWNFMPFGGYLAWRLYPTHQVLIDGRSGFVHDAGLARRAHESNFDAAAFDGLVGEFDIEWAVTRSSEGEGFGIPLATDLRWAMTFFDDVGAVYVRRSGPNAELAARGYRRFRHLTPLERVLEDATTGSHAGDLSHDGALAVEQAPASPRAWFLEASGALAVGDRARFERATGALGHIAPSHPALSTLHAAWGIARGGRLL